MISEFVYHIKPKKMFGKTLYALNELKEIKPEVYLKEVSKYKGREFLLKKRIMGMNFKWHDVIHLSVYKPHDLYKALKAAGYKPDSLEWYKIPMSLINTDEAIIYREYWDNEDWIIEIDEIFENSKIGNILDKHTIDYYKSCKAKGKEPLLFKNAKHLLYYGDIDITKCTVIDWSKEV